MQRLRGPRPGLEGMPLRSWRAVTALGLLGLFVLLYVVPPFVLFIAQAAGVPAQEPRLSLAALVASLAISVLLLGLMPIGYLRLVRPRERVWDLLQLRVRRNTPVYVGIGGGAAVLLLLALALVLQALSAAGAYEPEESQLANDLIALTRAYPILVLLVPLVAGVTEEIMFRGLLQPRIGLGASAVLFGVTHAGYGTALQVVGPFVAGLAFGLLYRWRPTLWLPISAHFFFDFLQLLASYASRAA